MQVGLVKRALAKGIMWGAYLQVILTRELAKGMVARNRGHIINVSSIAGHTPYPGGARSQSWLLECSETSGDWILDQGILDL